MIDLDTRWMAAPRVTSVHAELAPEHSWRLPGRPPVSVRGALGAALFDTLCLRADRRCAACPERERCLLPTWYDPSLLGGHDPRPYALQVDPGGHALVSPRRPLQVWLRFFGPIPRHSALVEALCRAAATGLGPDRARHQVRRLTVVGLDAPVVVVREDETVGRWPEPGPLSRHVSLPLDPRGVQVRLVTPLQIKTRGPRPTAAELLDAAIGRVRSVARRQDLRLERRWPETAGIEGEWADLRRVRGSREPSSGQGEHDLSGWVGTLTLGADALPFADLLAAAEVLHIGRGSSAGLGRVRLEWL